jgi:hypothetical protein
MEAAFAVDVHVADPANIHVNAQMAAGTLDINDLRGAPGAQQAAAEGLLESFAETRLNLLQQRANEHENIELALVRDFDKDHMQQLLERSTEELASEGLVRHGDKLYRASFKDGEGSGADALELLHKSTGSLESTLMEILQFLKHVFVQVKTHIGNNS